MHFGLIIFIDFGLNHVSRKTQHIICMSFFKNKKGTFPRKSDRLPAVTITKPISILSFILRGWGGEKKVRKKKSAKKKVPEKISKNQPGIWNLERKQDEICAEIRLHWDCFKIALKFHFLGGFPYPFRDAFKSCKRTTTAPFYTPWSLCDGDYWVKLDIQKIVNSLVSSHLHFDQWKKKCVFCGKWTRISKFNFLVFAESKL